MSDSDQDPVDQPEEGFISRWSRRKHADRAASNDVVSEMQSVDAVPFIEESELPGDDDMPPIESLDEDSDYSGFMSPKVSEGLRTLALRKLFRGQTFNLRDGLDDYDDDFSSFAKLGNVVTAEMRRQMERMKRSQQGDVPQADTTVSESESSDQPPITQEPPAESVAALDTNEHDDSYQADQAARTRQGIEDEEDE